MCVHSQDLLLCNEAIVFLFVNKVVIIQIFNEEHANKHA